jgi:hypothetical protein
MKEILMAKDVADELFGKESEKQSKAPEQKSMGGMEAALTGVIEGMKAYMAGMNAMIDAMPNELKDMWNHGRTEVAAALYNQSPYVMYQKGTHDQKENPDHGLGDMGLEQGKSKGRSM